MPPFSAYMLAAFVAGCCFTYWLYPRVRRGGPVLPGSWRRERIGGENISIWNEGRTVRGNGHGGPITMKPEIEPIPNSSRPGILRVDRDGLLITPEMAAKLDAQRREQTSEMQLRRCRRTALGTDLQMRLRDADGKWGSWTPITENEWDRLRAGGPISNEAYRRARPQ